jgi:hypothetical protein
MGYGIDDPLVVLVHRISESGARTEIAGVDRGSGDMMCIFRFR